MAENKTKKTVASVDDFFAAIDDDQIRADSIVLSKVMSKKTKAEARIWGANIVGFGDYHYKYESGREGDWFLCGFAPRKKHLTLYGISGISGKTELLKKLGKHKLDGGCLHIKKLSDINMNVLEQLIESELARD